MWTTENTEGWPDGTGAEEESRGLELVFIMSVGRFTVLTPSKLELLRSPYLESMRTHSSRLSASGNELYQAISQRQRAQTVLKDLQRKVTAYTNKQSTAVLSKGDTVPKASPSARQAELQQLQLRIRLQTEERKLRREDLRDQLLQQKRVLAT